MGEGQANAPHGIRRFLPILNWLPTYPARWLRADLVAGLVTAAVVIPQAMAYAASRAFRCRLASTQRWCRCWSMPCWARRGR
jgi:hypothetical protein